MLAVYFQIIVLAELQTPEQPPVQEALCYDMCVSSASPKI